MPKRSTRLIAGGLALGIGLMLFAYQGSYPEVCHYLKLDTYINYIQQVAYLRTILLWIIDETRFYNSARTGSLENL